MRLCHISDLHGTFIPLLGKFDFVVASGDILPNDPYNLALDRTLETRFQINWLKRNVSKIKEWLQNHAFLFIPGNHDFLPSKIIERILRSEDINAISLENKLVTFRDINFYGFPYVSFHTGSWNYELMPPEMNIKVDSMVDVCNSKHVNVLVCHSPIYGILDRNTSGNHIGSTAISNALQYKINPDKLPSYYLCGHCHEDMGIVEQNGILISNAALYQHIIDI
jgi:Icc-related predicted phosphoesterase